MASQNRARAARDHANTHREQGHRVATATDRENAKNSSGRSNAPKAIKDRATGNAAQRRT